MENKERENKNLKSLLILVGLIAIFEFFQVYHLRKKILATQQPNLKGQMEVLLQEKLKLETEVRRTRDYIKKVYETYECEDYYKEGDFMAEQIYNFLICVQKKGEGKK